MTSIRTRFTTVALAAVVACTSFGFTAADEAQAASKGKTAAAKVKKDAKKRKALAKGSARKIG